MRVVPRKAGATPAPPAEGGVAPTTAAPTPKWRGRLRHSGANRPGHVAVSERPRGPSVCSVKDRDPCQSHDVPQSERCVRVRLTSPSPAQSAGGARRGRAIRRTGDRVGRRAPGAGRRSDRAAMDRLLGRAAGRWHGGLRHRRRTARICGCRTTARAPACRRPPPEVSARTEYPWTMSRILAGQGGTRRDRSTTCRMRSTARASGAGRNVARGVPFRLVDRRRGRRRGLLVSVERPLDCDAGRARALWPGGARLRQCTRRKRARTRRFVRARCASRPSPTRRR